MPVINIDQTYLGMGVRHHEVTYRSGELTPDPAKVPGDYYGFLIYWPAAHTWLSADISSVGPSGQAETWVNPRTDQTAFEVVCAHAGTTPQALTPGSKPGFFEENQLWGAYIPRDSEIKLDFSIRTNMPSLAAQAATTAKTGSLQIKLKAIAFKAGAGMFHTQTWPIDVTLDPLVPLHAYSGIVALDLGNFSTGIACLWPTQFGPADIRTLCNKDQLKPRLVPAGQTMDSLVRIDSIRTWYRNTSPEKAGPRVFPDSASHPEDDLASAIEWTTGPQAGEGELTRQIPGPKRLLASADPETTRAMDVLHSRNDVKQQRREERLDVVRVKYRLAAELLTARMFQQFQQATEVGQPSGKPAGWPMYLIVTHPTSYSPREIETLRSTVHRGWLRALGLPQQPPAVPAPAPGSPPPPPAGGATTATPPASGQPGRDHLVRQLQSRLNRQGRKTNAEDPLIRMMIDEATAASFYYLYQFAAQSAGGFREFRYKYPAGMNMLLYDCGGGTTDVALVHGSVSGEQDNHLTVKVISRSGVRHFGGDDITAAVAKIFKAKLICLIAEEQNLSDVPALPPKNIDGKSADERLLNGALRMKKFLDEVRRLDPEDKLVPTSFDPGNFTPGAVPRRNNMMRLWRLSEKLKTKFGTLVEGNRLTSVSLRDISDKFGEGRGGLDKAVLEAVSPAARAKLIEDIRELEVHQWEVDGLIARQVVRSIACCRHLIEQHLGGQEVGSQVVHHVVVTGNAAQYPLIPAMLQNELNVSDLEPEHWFHFHEADLKSSVAKGAVRALAAKRGVGQVKIDFDSTLSECLPYDIAYHDLAGNDYPKLFKLQDLYRDMGTPVVPMAALRGAGGQVNTLLDQFTLFRKFPGDGDEVPRQYENLPAFDAEADIQTIRLNKGYTPFETFHFPKGITSDLKVGYSREEHQFIVEDASGQKGVRVPPRDGDFRHLPHYQRGNI